MGNDKNNTPSNYIHGTPPTRPRLNQQRLIERTAARLRPYGIRQCDVRPTVKVFLRVIREEIVAGKLIELRPLGLFGVRWRKPFLGSNPAYPGNPEKRVPVPGKWRPYFKPSKGLRADVDSSLNSDTEDVTLSTAAIITKRNS